MAVTNITGSMLAPPRGDKRWAYLSRAKTLRFASTNEDGTIYVSPLWRVVPGELSIAGFDDLPFAALLTPRLTTVRQRARDMGERAAGLLFARLDHGEGAPAEPFPATVQIRDSVGPPPPSP